MMKRRFVTALPPEEITRIAKTTGNRVILHIEESEPFHGMPRWRVVVEGSPKEVMEFMEKLKLSRAGG